MPTMRVSSDTIYVDWDTSDRLPEGCPPIIYGNDNSMKALANYFEHSKNHIKWSSFRRCYVMSLSKQNVKRLKADFPNIRLIEGKPYLDQLHAKNNELVDVSTLALKSKNAPYDNLPKYDYKVPPLGEYQHRGVVLLNNCTKVPLFADCGLGKCREGDSMVTTSDGPLTLKDIWGLPGYVQDTEDGQIKILNNPIHVFSFNSKWSGCWVKTDKIYRELLPIGSKVRIVSSSNTEKGMVTLNHKFLLSKGSWSNEINKKDVIWLPKEITPKNSKTRLNPDEVLFFAWWLADAHDYRNNSCSITCYDPELRRELMSLAKRLSLVRYYDEKYKTVYIRNMRSLRDKWFRELGFSMNKLLSRDKYIPTGIINADEISKKLFLRFYISKKGYVSNTGSVEVSSASRKTIYSLSQMLLSFGIVSRIKSKKARATNGKNIYRTYYFLQITGAHVRRFYTEIGLYQKDKQKALKEVVKKPHNPNKDLLPLRDFALQLKQKLRLSEKQLFNTRSFFSCRKGGLSRTVASFMVKNYPEHTRVVKKYLNANAFYDEVKTSEVTSLSEPTYVYDMVVPKTHNYVVNGQWSHNTYMVLNSTEAKIKRQAVQKGKTLICAKLNTLETGWLEDAATFTNLKVGVLWTHKKYKRKQKILEVLNDPQYDIFVVNHEGVKVIFDELVAHRFEKVVIDESTILKGYKGMHKNIKGGEFGRLILQVAEHAKWRVVMSGTPAPNGPQDLWGQFAFLDPEGLVLEPSYNDFIRSYFKKIYFGKVNKRDKVTGALTNPSLKEGDPLDPKCPSKTIPTKEGIEAVGNLIAPLSYRLKLEDCVDLPEINFRTKRIDMDPQQHVYYEDMKQRMKVELPSAEVRASVKLAVYGKLRQITSGFLIDHDEKTHDISFSPKLEAIKQLVEEEIDSNEKILIFAEFRHEIETLTEVFKKHGALSVYGGNTSKQNMDNIKAFKRSKQHRILILNPQSAAHGVNLTESRYVIFFSISYSAEFNYQAIGRIKRATQKRAMMIYYLLCRNSIDESIYNVIVTKVKNQHNLIDVNQDDVEEAIVAQFLHGEAA